MQEDRTSHHRCHGKCRTQSYRHRHPQDLDHHLQPLWAVLTADGPRTDVSDITTYTYYAADDTDLGKRGNLATITNALGHVTQITAYDLNGNPLTVIDPNGVTTTLTYDPRQRLTSRTVGTERTSYDYDGVGQLLKVTLPDGSLYRLHLG